MKTIGLIGGTSFESTITYYQVINETVNKILGEHNTAKCILYSVNFQDIERNVATDQWDNISAILVDAAVTLEKAGADFLMVCTNTLHKLVPDIERHISIPILHIAEATAEVLIKEGIQKVGLLGTKPTMTHDFYKQKLLEKGIDVIVPAEEDIELVNTVIFDELCHGIIKPDSKNEYLRIIDYLHQQGAQGVVLGCTEIDLLVQQSDTSVPLFDTTLIHANEAALKAVQ